MQHKITVTHPWGSIHQCLDFCVFRIWALLLPLMTQVRVQFCAKGRLIQLNLLHSHSMLLPAFYTGQLLVSLCLFKKVILFRYWSLFICHFSPLQLLSPHGKLLSQNSLLNLPVEIGPQVCNALIHLEIFHMQIRCTTQCIWLYQKLPG